MLTTATSSRTVLLVAVGPSCSTHSISPSYHTVFSGSAPHRCLTWISATIPQLSAKEPLPPGNLPWPPGWSQIPSYVEHLQTVSLSLEHLSRGCLHISLPHLVMVYWVLFLSLSTSAFAVLGTAWPWYEYFMNTHLISPIKDVQIVHQGHSPQLGPMKFSS